jgi:hypothetical protein
MKWHPDRNPGDASSEMRFKEINEAYRSCRVRAGRHGWRWPRVRSRLRLIIL